MQIKDWWKFFAAHPLERWSLIFSSWIWTPQMTFLTKNMWWKWCLLIPVWLLCHLKVLQRFYALKNPKTSYVHMMGNQLTEAVTFSLISEPSWTSSLSEPSGDSSPSALWSQPYGQLHERNKQLLFLLLERDYQFCLLLLF
jgi:hypothetical protein